MATPGTSLALASILAITKFEFPDNFLAALSYLGANF